LHIFLKNLTKVLNQNFSTSDVVELKTENDRIINADPATISQYIKSSNYGNHNLVIYPHLQQFEEFYIECCKDSILDRSEIIIVATYYQPVSEVRKKLHLLGGIDTAKYENHGALIILDSETAYQPSAEQTGRYNIVMILTSLLINQAQERNKKGITLLTDLGTFFLTKRIAELISYEVSVPSRIDSNVRSFCCYHKDDFSVLQEGQRKRILHHHWNTLFLG
jgi:MEDS: MEthanogen/methylotroph, DcmR Sensory domain